MSAAAPSAADVAATPEPSQTSPADTADDVRQAVLAAVPEAARLRAQTTLVEHEWSVPVIPWQSLGKGHGIAVVPKQHLAQVIQAVGFSGKSIAAVLTEDPIDWA